MQIREISLKELESAYELVKELRSELSYDEFEDLVYAMRHQEYKMFGIYESDQLITYAGLSVLINLYHKRHLYIFDLVTTFSYRSQGYGKSMLAYLYDYAKIQNCEHVVLSSGLKEESNYHFYENEAFEKRGDLFVKRL
jgi:GNAT superfamily N-acetyltransferase